MAAARRAPTLSSRLLMLVAAVAGPFMVLTGAVIWSSYREDRARAEERLLEQTRALALAVDREVERVVSVLGTLAASPRLAGGDLSAFEADARTASIVLRGAPVMLLDREGRQVLSIRWAPGEHPRVAAGPPGMVAAFETGRPAISDMYVAPSGRRAIAVGVPTRSGEFAVVAAMSPELLGTMLGEQRLPEGWVGAVLDRSYHVIARSVSPELFVGTPAIAATQAALSAAPEGVFHARRVDGVYSSLAFARGPESQFAVVLAVGDDLLSAPLKVGLWRTLTVGLLATACGLGLALITGRGIAAGIQGLASGSAAPAGGGPALREVQEVANRLSRLSAERDKAEAALRALAERLEEQVSARTAALARNEARLRAIFDAQFQFITLLSPDGTRLEMNAAALAFGGQPASEVIGRKLWEVSWWSHDPRRVARMQDAVARAAAGEFVRFESEASRPDGSTVAVDFSIKPIFDPATGAVTMLIGEGRDITELRRLEARLAQASRMEALGQLAGGIAHDFNNVLQAVAGGISLIAKRADDPASVARLARMVAEAAERGASITRRLLGFARRDELRAAPVELPALLDGMQEVLRYTLGAGIEVRAEAAPGLPAVLVDRGQLETVLVNLATNARDAMPEGGTLTMSAATETIAAREGPGLPPGVYVRLAVQDTGSGMAPATLARAMEPFFTTKDVGKGTGLGLSMARGFAEQSGGAMDIASAPGEGTTVTMWLPQAAAGAPGPASALPPVESAIGSHLLLVEDEAMVRTLLASELSGLGFQLTTAPDGPTALALLDGGAPVDLLVTDLAMPGMGGLDLIRAAHGRRPGLPAILLTGYAGEAASLAVGGALSGAFTLLRKPVSAAQVADRAAALLERRQAAPR